MVYTSKLAFQLWNYPPFTVPYTHHPPKNSRSNCRQAGRVFKERGLASRLHWGRFDKKQSFDLCSTQSIRTPSEFSEFSQNFSEFSAWEFSASESMDTTDATCIHTRRTATGTRTQARTHVSLSLGSRDRCCRDCAWRSRRGRPPVSQQRRNGRETALEEASRPSRGRQRRPDKRLACRRRRRSSR